MRFHAKKFLSRSYVNEKVEWIDITFDKSRVNAQIRTGNIENAKRLETIGTIKLRFVKIRLNSGTDEYLITNYQKAFTLTNVRIKRKEENLFC